MLPAILRASLYPPLAPVRGINGGTNNESITQWAQGTRTRTCGGDGSF